MHPVTLPASNAESHSISLPRIFRRTRPMWAKAQSLIYAFDQKEALLPGAAAVASACEWPTQVIEKRERQVRRLGKSLASDNGLAERNSVMQAFRSLAEGAGCSARPSLMSLERVTSHLYHYFFLSPRPAAAACFAFTFAYLPPVAAIQSHLLAHTLRSSAEARDTAPTAKR